MTKNIFIIKIKTQEQISKLTKILILLYILLLPPILLSLPWSQAAIYHLYISDSFPPHTSILHQSVSNLKPQQAVNLLENYLKKQNSQLTLYFKNKKITINKEDIGIKYDLNETVNDSYKKSKYKGFPKLIAILSFYKQKPNNFNLAITYNQQALDSKVASIAAQINQRQELPSVSIIQTSIGKTATVSAGNSGLKLNIIKTKKMIIDAYAKQNFKDLQLPVIVDLSIPETKQINETKQLAQNLINKSLILKYQDQTWELDDQVMVSFLSFKNHYNSKKIYDWISQLSQLVNRPPQNALFEFDGQKVKEFKEALPGIAIDKKQTTEAIKTAIADLANSQEKSKDVELKTIQTPAEITTDQVNNLGIKELLGEGESWFHHSIPGRVYNINLSASKIHGTLVAPGEVFSFIKTVGDIDAAHGYQPSYVIQNGRTVLGDGGGVCQTSTTLFRAVLASGLDIVERNAHAYRVSYYEENYDVGVDATIFSPTVDFKFRNDTANYILIQRNIDLANYYLNFKIFGTSDGRKATISKSKIWSQTPPPPDLYQDDPTLAPGVVKQIDWKAWGAKVSFDWQVEKDGQILHQQTFYSNYRPWQAVYLRGV